MRYLPLIAFASLGLASCSYYEASIDDATELRNEHHKAYHQEHGCPFTGDHDAYRECVLKTYYQSKPKTFVPAKTEDGKSLAIIRNESSASYDEKTDTYKTERVIVIETEERLVPVNGSTTEIQSQEVTSETTQEEVTVSKEAKEDVETTHQEAIETLTTNTVSKEETIPVVPAEQEKSWWEKYKQDKKDVSTEVKCPCDDPNEPCPQCYDK